MDYSLISYLSRRTIKETESVLLYYMEESGWHHVRSVVSDIIRLLEKRYADEGVTMPPEIAEAKTLHEERLAAWDEKKPCKGRL